MAQKQLLERMVVVRGAAARGGGFHRKTFCHKRFRALHER